MTTRAGALRLVRAAYTDSERTPEELASMEDYTSIGTLDEPLLFTPRFVPESASEDRADADLDGGLDDPEPLDWICNRCEQGACSRCRDKACACCSGNPED